MTQNISEEETERDRALKGMTCGKAVRADEILAEARKCMGNFGIKIIGKLAKKVYINQSSRGNPVVKKR